MSRARQSTDEYVGAGTGPVGWRLPTAVSRSFRRAVGAGAAGARADTRTGDHAASAVTRPLPTTPAMATGRPWFYGGFPSKSTRRRRGR